jgi:hypothetical protein
MADEATAEHHTVDGVRHPCHTGDHYCPGADGPSRVAVEAQQPAEETHVVADDSDDPEHVDDCPGCEAFTLTGHIAEAQQPETQFGSPDCTCIPWTQQGGAPRYCGPKDTVDMISGWEIGRDCPHHAPPAPLRRSWDDCPGFPEQCPNIRPVDPDPPTHFGGIRCGCADEARPEAKCARCDHGKAAHNVSGCLECPGGWRAGHRFLVVVPSAKEA